MLEGPSSRLFDKTSPHTPQMGNLRLVNLGRREARPARRDEDEPAGFAIASQAHLDLPDMGSKKKNSPSSQLGTLVFLRRVGFSRGGDRQKKAICSLHLIHRISSSTPLSRRFFPKRIALLPVWEPICRCSQRHHNNVAKCATAATTNSTTLRNSVCLHAPADARTSNHTARSPPWFIMQWAAMLP